jgi:FlaA1/EpsC-like NDP-sugar epimerase
MACFSFLVSYLLRFGFEIPDFRLQQSFLFMPSVAVIKVGVFRPLSGRLTNWRNFGARSFLHMGLYAACCSLLVFAGSSLASPPFIPRGVIIIGFLVTVSLCIGMELMLKSAAART